MAAAPSVQVAQENVTEDNASHFPPSVQVAQFASDSQINTAMLHIWLMT
jgi:hypothetical protein